MKFKIIYLTLALVLVFSMAAVIVPANPASAQVVTFPDPNLEAAIRDAIGKPTGDIYQSDLDSLTYLFSQGGGITNLIGLEHCTSLTSLIISWASVGDQISDISPISTLISLTYLQLLYHQISDLSPLASLTNLTGLYLNGNQISDLSPLASLTNLTWLDLTSNQISNISPLSGLTSLSYLTLDNNQISDMEPLVNNPGLGPGGHDVIQITYNPLSSASTNNWIPSLQDRGVLVGWNSIETATSTGMATLDFGEGSTAEYHRLSAVPESSVSAQGKPSLQFPHGFFEFEITNLSGPSVDLIITLPSAVPVGTQYWKWGPTPSQSTAHWYQIPIGDDDGDNVIIITLVDGGLGDDDLTANGVIVDQGGPGQGYAGATGVPVFPTWYIGIAAALGAGMLAYLYRRRVLGRKTTEI